MHSIMGRPPCVNQSGLVKRIAVFYRSCMLRSQEAAPKGWVLGFVPTAKHERGDGLYKEGCDFVGIAKLSGRSTIHMLLFATTILGVLGTCPGTCAGCSDPDPYS